MINARDEVLGIQEKRGVTAGLTDFWKIPGGLVDRGEDLRDAAVREVSAAFRFMTCSERHDASTRVRTAGNGGDWD